jgi:hypothetical protein
MADDNTNTAAQDLGVAPAPVAPVVMSYAEANSRRAEFMQSAELRDKLMAGDIETTHLWRRITEGLSAQPPDPTGPREATAIASWGAAWGNRSQNMMALATAIFPIRDSGGQAAVKPCAVGLMTGPCSGISRRQFPLAGIAAGNPCYHPFP